MQEVTEAPPLTRLTQIEALLIVISERLGQEDEEDIRASLHMIVQTLDSVRKDLAICLEPDDQLPGQN